MTMQTPPVHGASLFLLLELKNISTFYIMNRIYQLIIILVVIITSSLIIFGVKEYFQLYTAYEGLGMRAVNIDIDGSYSQTCSNCKMSMASGRPGLTCNCNNMQGQPVTTTMNVAMKGVNNCNGTLT